MSAQGTSVLAPPRVRMRGEKDTLVVEIVPPPFQHTPVGCGARVALVAFALTGVGLPLVVPVVWMQIARDNVVQLRLGPSWTELRFVGRWWPFRPTRRAGAAAAIDVVARQFHNEGGSYTLEYLVVTDVVGRTIEMQLGMPGEQGTNPANEAILDEIRALAAPVMRAAKSSILRPREIVETGRGRCPRDGSALAAPSGPLHVSSCPACSGGHVEPAGFALVLERMGLAVDDVRSIAAHFAGRALVCSGCGAKTQAVKLRSTNIDVCFSCGGAWLDDGEVNAFHALFDGPSSTSSS